MVAVAAAAATVASAVIFVLRPRGAAHPLLDVALITRPLVSSGLAFKAAAGLAVAGLSYLVTLQLQLDWGWTPARAALGMLPQVVVLRGCSEPAAPTRQRRLPKVAGPRLHEHREVVVSETAMARVAHVRLDSASVHDGGSWENTWACCFASVKNGVS